GLRTEFHLRFRRIARLSALHAARGFSRHGGAGSAGERQPRPDSQLAPQNGFGKNAAQPSGFTGAGGADGGRQGISGPDQAGPGHADGDGASPVSTKEQRKELGRKRYA